MEIKQASIEDLEQIREIFFESSTKKELKAKKQKRSFFINIVVFTLMSLMISS
jgi:hypothetical protein